MKIIPQRKVQVLVEGVTYFIQMFILVADINCVSHQKNENFNKNLNLRCNSHAIEIIYLKGKVQ